MSTGPNYFSGVSIDSLRQECDVEAVDKESEICVFQSAKCKDNRYC